MVRPVAARQPSIRWGRYWIFFSLRLTMRTRPSRSAAAKLAMARLSSDQMPSAHPHHGPGPARRPGASFRRAQPLARLVLEADEGAQVARGAFISGHTSAFHTPTPSSSRSIAWRAGPPPDQPRPRLSLPVPPPGYPTLNNPPVPP